MATLESPAVRLLRDPDLFRQACYINGRWIDVSRGAAIEGDDPAGIGREGSRYGIDEFAEIEYIGMGGF